MILSGKASRSARGVLDVLGNGLDQDRRHPVVAALFPGLRVSGWRVRYAVTLVWQVPMEAVLDFVDPALEPFVDDGLGYVELGLVRFEHGNIEGEGTFDEVSFAVRVRRTDALPSDLVFAFETKNIAATSERFLDLTEQGDRFPVFRTTGLTFDFDEVRHVTHVRDDHGPICTLRAGETSSFHAFPVPIQVFARMPPQLYRSTFVFLGQTSWRKDLTERSEFHPHPFFRGFDVGALAHGVPAESFVARPGALGWQVFVGPNAIDG